MSLPNLDRLVTAGMLHAEPPAAAEFAGLLRSGLARLNDAGNAALALECLAALRRHGYRPANKRYIVFQVLPDTLGLGPEVWRVLGKAHELRNRSEYEGEQNVDQRLVTDLLAACVLLAKKVQAVSPPAP
jgi:hypothetical protein